MRYRLAALCLFVMLPVLFETPAASLAEVYAVLDIGPPPKGLSTQQHQKLEIDRLTSQDGTPSHAWLAPEIRHLNPVAAREDARPWLADHVRVVPDDRESRLRLTFQAGDRAERVLIVNSLLKTYLQLMRRDRIRGLEKRIREQTAGTEDVERELQRVKKIDVIRWAK
jgi:hypothetical protein